MRNTAWTHFGVIQGSSRHPAKDAREGLSVCTGVISKSPLRLGRDLQIVCQIIIAPPQKKKGHRVSIALWPKKRPSGEGWPCFFILQTIQPPQAQQKRVRFIASDPGGTIEGGRHGRDRVSYVAVNAVPEHSAQWCGIAHIHDGCPV